MKNNYVYVDPQSIKYLINKLDQLWLLDSGFKDKLLEGEVLIRCDNDDLSNMSDVCQKLNEDKDYPSKSGIKFLKALIIKNNNFKNCKVNITV